MYFICYNMKYEDGLDAHTSTHTHIAFFSSKAPLGISPCSAGRQQWRAVRGLHHFSWPGYCTCTAPVGAVVKMAGDRSPLPLAGEGWQGRCLQQEAKLYLGEIMVNSSGKEAISLITPKERKRRGAVFSAIRERKWDLKMKCSRAKGQRHKWDISSIWCVNTSICGTYKEEAVPLTVPASRKSGSPCVGGSGNSCVPELLLLQNTKLKKSVFCCYLLWRQRGNHFTGLEWECYI